MTFFEDLQNIITQNKREIPDLNQFIEQNLDNIELLSESQLEELNLELSQIQAKLKKDANDLNTWLFQKEIATELEIHDENNNVKPQAKDMVDQFIDLNSATNQSNQDAKKILTDLAIKISLNGNNFKKPKISFESTEEFETISNDPKIKQLWALINIAFVNVLRLLPVITTEYLANDSTLLTVSDLNKIIQDKVKQIDHEIDELKKQTKNKIINIRDSRNVDERIAQNHTHELELSEISLKMIEEERKLALANTQELKAEALKNLSTAGMILSVAVGISLTIFFGSLAINQQKSTQPKKEGENVEKIEKREKESVPPAVKTENKSEK